MRAPQRVEKTGWHVVLAEDYYHYAIVIERALKKAAGVPMEMLLLDLKMPGMAGHEALEEIKWDDRLRSIPVAILTSSDRDDDVAKSYGLGGNHFITKPSNLLELKAKLSALLRNVTELGAIRRGATGASTTAVSAVDCQSMAAVKVLRWVAVVGVLIALYFYGRVTGAF